MGRPAPAGLWDAIREHQHPALTLACPHCGAHPHKPCTTPSKRRRLDTPHPSRITAQEATP